MTKRLRIAVYHNLPSGGAKRTLQEIVRRLSDRHHLDLYELACSNHDFCDVRPFVEETYTYPFNPLPEFQRPLGRMNFAARLLDLFRLDRLQQRIAADIDQRRYDVVYVQPCHFAQTPYLLRFLRTPSLYHSHEPMRSAYEPPIPRPYRTRRGARQVLDRLDPVLGLFQHTKLRLDLEAAREASLVITNSYFTREALYRFYQINARVCYHGLDGNAFRPLGLPRGRNTVLSVGTLHPAKGFDLIIESLALLPAQVRPKLVIVSNLQASAELSYLTHLANELEVSVEFRHQVTDRELIELYNSVALTVYAPVLEPFGLVPLESMACGTPVVAVCEGGVRETVLDGRTGFLVDRDPGQFAQAVATLIKERELAESYGKQAREYILSKWRWEDAVCKIEHYLDQTRRCSV